MTIWRGLALILNMGGDGFNAYASSDCCHQNVDVSFGQHDCVGNFKS